MSLFYSQQGYGLQTVLTAGVVGCIFVGDGLLLLCFVVLWEIRAFGALSSHRVPSIGLLLLLLLLLQFILSGDADEAGIIVLGLIGAKALRTTSSGDDSLPLSLGLRGGVLDGLFGRRRLAGADGVVVVGGVVE